MWSSNIWKKRSEICIDRVNSNTPRVKHFSVASPLLLKAEIHSKSSSVEQLLLVAVLHPLTRVQILRVARWTWVFHVLGVLEEARAVDRCQQLWVVVLPLADHIVYRVNVDPPLFDVHLPLAGVVLQHRDDVHLPALGVCVHLASAGLRPCDGADHQVVQRQTIGRPPCPVVAQNLCRLCRLVPSPPLLA